MAEYPSMPLFTDAFLADTMHLSAEETGAYLCLLMAAWRRPNCDLPDDDRMLARMARLDLETWQAVKPTVMDFWTYDGRSRTWSQKRQKKERRYVDDVREKKRKAAATRWKRDKKPDASACAEPMHPESTHTHTYSNVVSSSPDGEKETTARSAPQDPKKAMWAAGVALLTEAGHDDKSARTILGRLIKQSGEAAVITAVSRAVSEKPVDPVQFLQGCLRFQKNTAQPKNGQIRERNGVREQYMEGTGWLPMN